MMRIRNRNTAIDDSNHSFYMNINKQVSRLQLNVSLAVQWFSTNNRIESRILVSHWMANSEISWKETINNQ